jgi:malonate-semialdehyde dehydrogenase (acetylating)/methylmalonate-semialdehyde dehydrogenase
MVGEIMSHTKISPVFEQERADAPLRNFIGGEWRPARTSSTDTVFNPATGEEIARVPLCGAGDVDAAVQAAAHAFSSWRDTPVPDRVQYLFRFKHLLEENFAELAREVTRENGKTIEDARGEVRRGIEVVDFACGMATLMMGETAEQIARGIDSYSVRVPLGVVGGICPFNFPAMIPMWMAPIAIAAGNTFVLKPSERTPISASLLLDLLSRAGLPGGVVNLVHGAREAVDSLLAHPEVRAISFVGSAPVARYVYEQAAAHGKRVQALAGAKNHLLVMADADLPLTAKAILSSAFGAAGQRCLAGSVVVAVGDIGDTLVASLCARASDLRLGDGLQEDTAIGPLVRSDARTRICGYVEKGLREGARLVLDGRAARPATAESRDGFFAGPSIFDHVHPEMVIAREEIFGPVLSVIRARDLDEAIAIANRSRFGNAASIFTRSGEAARRFRTRIEAGMVGINVGVAAPMAFFPFAGWKGSFFGDLHATGKDAVRFYTETRVVVERWSA